MSFAGFKKQINKANQYMSEKIGSAQPTKPSEEFIQLEAKTDVTNEVVELLIDKTKDILHPNPTLRAKIAVTSKINAKKEKYPHPEKDLGESMVKYGTQLGKESNLGQSLIEMGLTLKETTEIKYSLEDSVKKKFLDPLNRLQMRDIKDCSHHRNKLQSRRLDYDCKKRKKLKGINIFDTDIKIAEDKYEEALKLATVSMQQLLEKDKQQVSQLAALSESLFEYHTQCANIYKSLTTRLKRKSQQKAPDLNQVWNSALNKTNATVDQYKGVSGLMKLNGQMRNGMSSTTNFVSSQSKSVSKIQNSINCSKYSQNQIPKCRALYDFLAENDNELSFKEGDVIELTDQVDDHWFEGTLNGRVGIFPISYVEVMVALSHHLFKDQ